jgi:hypothetical protein
MEALIKIQKELKVPKGNFNSFGKYKYRSCEDILEALKPILAKQNAMLILTDEIVAIGSKLFMKSTACLTMDEKQICVDGFAELSEHKGMSAEQCTGTASSYARKYALNGLFLIDETEADPDHSQQPQQPQKQASKPLISDKQWAALLVRVKDGDSAAMEAAQKAFTLGAAQIQALTEALPKSGIKSEVISEIPADLGDIPF